MRRVAGFSSFSIMGLRQSGINRGLAPPRCARRNLPLSRHSRRDEKQTAPREECQWKASQSGDEARGSYSQLMACGAADRGSRDDMAGTRDLITARRARATV